ncbi:uncharacterized protein C4orf54 homolog [Heterodontus francisci]|uniref:uncharacterized protein C4orf54 homolog n=1 Tax=Heterodontus francisci TaxID=7792 RepID=UPI00355B8AA5
MLCLHFSVARARPAAVNGTLSAHGTGDSVPSPPVKGRGVRAVSGGQVPAPSSRGVTNSEAGNRARLPGVVEGTGGDPAERAGGTGGDPAEQPKSPEVEREESVRVELEAGMRREETPGDSRRSNAGGEETRAGESGSRRHGLADGFPAEFSGYDTAVGSDISESFSDCDGDKLGSASGAAPFHPCFGPQIGRKDGGAQLIVNTGRGESDSCELLLWDHFQPCSNDEVHYISTQEIQLFELDHDGDWEFGMGSGCYVEEGSALYSLLDSSSSLESDISEEGSDTPRGTSCASDAPPGAGAADEAPKEEMASGESVADGGGLAEGQPGSASPAGHIRLSIRASSRAVGENRSDQGKECGSHSQEEREQRVCGNSGRLTVAASANGATLAAESNASGQSKSKKFDYCSGTSSAVSELDDADKEVRSLTARAFRSLACPGDEYLDTYCAGNRSTDLSSLSEESIGFNRWAQYVDAQCRNAMKKKDQTEFPGKNAKASIGPERAGSNKEQEAARVGEWQHVPAKGLTVTVNGKQENAAGAEKQTGSKRRIQVTGRFEQVESKVITSSETFNLVSDVKELPVARKGSQRSVPQARNVPGSRCADGVREQGGESGTAAEAMESTQRKSKLASNLLQNVIWKKMQYEQELKMERGEISDTSFAAPPSPSAQLPEAEPGHLQRNNGSKFPGGSPESSPEPGQVSGGAAQGGERSGAAESGQGGWLPSQHSAFRSWRESEARPRLAEARAAQRVRAHIGRQAVSKQTKMSHLFVPSIQIAAPKGAEWAAAAGGDRAPPEGGEAGGKSAASRHPDTNCRSPEIRIRLRSRKDKDIAKLLTPNIGWNEAAGLLQAADDSKYQAWFGEEAPGGEENKNKAPHFSVRDIRDNVHKLHTPIHQVRDVRKLVKSSYHILTLQGNKVKSSEQAPCGKGASLLPIVIKCQSVSSKTLAGLKQGQSTECLTEGSGGPSPDTGMKNGSVFPHRASGRIPLKGAAAGSPPAAASVPAPGGEKQRGTGCKVASKQLALEKLTAAVKTMEELYVFDKNEWKRKSEPAPGPPAGSHVLSLIASEEASCSCGVANPPGDAQSPGPARPGGKSTGPQLLTGAPVFPSPSHVPPSAASSSRESVPGAKSTPPPPPDFRWLRAPRRQSLEESEKQCKAGSVVQTPAAGESKSPPQQPLPSEYGNYLTIPIKQPAAPREPPPPAIYSLPPAAAAPAQSSSPEQQREASPATVYPQRPPGLPAPEQPSPAKGQQLVVVDSPPVPCFPPPPPTQRKMLLDPATGQYYLVDTPVQPARKRLYDPETGHYVDVPMPQQPLAPVSVPMSPIAINPGTYGTTYMIYPGFLPTPAMLPTLQTQLSRPENECNETVKPNSTVSQQSEAYYMESPYYFPTGKSLNPPHTLTSQHITRASKSFSEGKPVISITSQPGPRIIAPPSFDGTTMSFIVEHR